MKKSPAKIVLYYCRNLMLFENGQHKEFTRSRPGLKLVSIPCSGKMEAHHLLKTLATGVQGVLVLACAEKACRFFEGSMRSHRRLDYARTWLQEVGIEPERLQFIHAPPKDPAEVDKIVTEFTSTLESLGQFPTIAQSSGS